MTIRSIITASILFIGLFSFANAQGTNTTGEFTISSTPSAVLGANSSNYNSVIDQNANITWEVFVPKTYNPSEPAGIMVFAGAPQQVRPPMGWLSVMEDSNLIWVAARKSDNGASIHQRELLAMMSVPLIEERYNINKDRIYITGEGRISGMAAMDYPEIFKGAIYLGQKVWSDDAADKIAKLINNRYVFVTNRNHMPPRSVRYAHSKYEDAGVKNTKLLHIKTGLRFSRPKLAESIAYLDNPGSVD
ncbi:MAG: hypothetical protein HOH19_06545 [Kordiimonadaceae bacterium]|jgi:hypothetical protein|nr:hypothetical protein [Kordiimonadaceae bacterium]MBT6032215.1 hypothetical protein [Kordiimonadaceae bacterium]